MTEEGTEGIEAELAPPNPSVDAELNGADQQKVEIPITDEKSRYGDTECLPEDVTMADGEICDQVEAIKQLFLERSKDYGIPQLEQLYTRVMKGVFETKSRAKVEDLRASILRFLFEFAEDQSKC